MIPSNAMRKLLHNHLAEEERTGCLHLFFVSFANIKSVDHPTHTTRSRISAIYVGFLKGIIAAVTKFLIRHQGY